MPSLKAMQTANPFEFEPKTIIFYTSGLDNSRWRNCFTIKSFAVAAAITGTKPVNPFMASNLLIHITNQLLVPAQPQWPKIKADGKLEEDISKNMMEAIDVVYLIVGFLRDLELHAKSRRREEVDAYFISTDSQQIALDVIKIHNQLPLDRIIFFVDKIEEAIRSTGEILMQTKMVAVDDPLLNSLKKFNLTFSKDKFYEVINSFCWYYSPFFSASPRAGDFSNSSVISERKNLLDCLHSTLITSNVNTSNTTTITTTPPQKTIPAAAKLVKSGVRLAAEDSGCVQATFDKPVLKLPALIYDFKMETVARNLLAWELQPRQKPLEPKDEALETEEIKQKKKALESVKKPITGYFGLMNELIGDARDVSAMKKRGVLKIEHKKKAEEVLGFLKTITVEPSVYYAAIDVGMEKVLKFHEERMNNFFVRNKNTIYVGAVGTMLVLGTAIFVRRRGQGFTLVPISKHMLISDEPTEES